MWEENWKSKLRKSQNDEKSAAKTRKTLMLVFTSKYTIIFCAFMQAAQHSSALMKRQNKNKDGK